MFTQTAEYALRAMSCLAARSSELVSTGALAGFTKVPTNYLAKVLQQLADAGLVTGRRGVGGGYKLARGPAEISLFEIVDAVCPAKRVNSCPLCREEHRCPLHRRTDAAAAAVNQMFMSATLADLLADEEPMCAG